MAGQPVITRHRRKLINHYVRKREYITGGVSHKTPKIHESIVGYWDFTLTELFGLKIFAFSYVDAFYPI